MVAVSAHRGGSETAPSGTWAAYEDAMTAGADYIEVDVQRTRDGELVVFHGARGIRPRLLTRAELDVAAGFPVPGFADLLRSIGGRSRVHIDLKQPELEHEMMATVLATVGAGNFIVTGNDANVAAVKRHYPEARTAVSLGAGWFDIRLSQMLRIRHSELFPLARIRACGADAVAVHHRLARLGVLTRCAREGIGVMIWTVNRTALIHSFMRDSRVEVLITDRPRYALSLI
jgi:glycerophosphoryl diester phosphodiesterase